MPKYQLPSCQISWLPLGQTNGLPGNLGCLVTTVTHSLEDPRSLFPLLVIEPLSCLANRLPCPLAQLWPVCTVAWSQAAAMANSTTQEIPQLFPVSSVKLMAGLESRLPHLSLGFSLPG